MSNSERSEHRPNKVSKIFDYLGVRYKVEYIYGSGVMAIFEEVTHRPWWRLFEKTTYWKRLYFGYRGPIKRALAFADDHRWTDINWDEIVEEHKPQNQEDIDVKE